MLAQIFHTRKETINKQAKVIKIPIKEGQDIANQGYPEKTISRIRAC